MDSKESISSTKPLSKEFLEENAKKLREKTNLNWQVTNDNGYFIIMLLQSYKNSFSPNETNGFIEYIASNNISFQKDSNGKDNSAEVERVFVEYLKSKKVFLIPLDDSCIDTDRQLDVRISNPETILNLFTSPEKTDEISKNSQVLSQSFRDHNSTFYRCFGEEQHFYIKIASLMGSDRNKIEDDEDGYKIAESFFGKPK